jgi:hypothetical protein
MPIESRLFIVQIWRTHSWRDQHVDAMHRWQDDSPDRCDFGVKTAAFAALGEIAALRADAVTDPFGVVVSGVNEGESTLKRFFAFSFWLSLTGSWM